MQLTIKSAKLKKLKEFRRELQKRIAKDFTNKEEENAITSMRPEKKEEKREVEKKKEEDTEIDDDFRANVKKFFSSPTRETPVNPRAKVVSMDSFKAVPKKSTPTQKQATKR